MLRDYFYALLFLPAFAWGAKQLFEINLCSEFDCVLAVDVGCKSRSEKAEYCNICKAEPEFPSWQVAEDAAKHQGDRCAWWEVAKYVSQCTGAVWHKYVNEEDWQNR